MASYSYTNDDVDPRVAYYKASKALYIIFILLILLANGVLIFMNARKPDFISKPKTLTIISLAIGDVFLALFPMIVQTKFLFEDYIFTWISCETIASADVYGPYLITFVYGIGLMVLGFEIVQSHKNSLLNKSKQILYSVAHSSFPWILGLITILPLGMSNTCPLTQTLSQIRALIVIAIILPACGAVITAIVVKSTKSPTANSPARAFIDSSSQSTTFTAQTPNPARVIPGNPSESQTSTHSSPPTDPATQGQYPNYPQQPPQFYNQSQHHLYLSQGSTQFENRTYYLGNFTESTSQTSILNPPVTLPSDATLKVNRLLAISIVNFFLVIPIAIFDLSYLSLNANGDVLSPKTLLIIHGLVVWLNYLRSVITPLMMYGYSD